MASGLEKTSPSWKPPHSHSSSTLSSPHSRQVRGHNLDRSEDGGALIPNVSPPQLIKDWEVIDDLQAEMHAGGESPQDLTAPGICEGYLLKRRKWPLKGWHKRYFVLEAGILRYSKNQHDVLRGRVQGSLDVSHAVMAINRKSYRIDLDAGDILYHIKAKSHELFYIWVTKLQAHRLYRRKEAAHVQSGLLTALAHCAAGGLAHRNGDLVRTVKAKTADSNCALGLGDLTVAPGVPPSASTAVNKKVSAWLQQSHQPDACAQELNRCHLDLSELNRLIKSLQTLELGQAFTNGDLKRIISIQKPKKSKSGKIWGHSRTLSRVEALGMVRRPGFVFVLNTYLQNKLLLLLFFCIVRCCSSIKKILIRSAHCHLCAFLLFKSKSPHISLQNLYFFHLGHSHLGASVPSIPDYVYSQLSLPTATLSSESKKIQQDICTVSLRGQRNGKAGNSNSKRMSTIPFSLLNSARFPEVCARNAVPGEAEAAGSLGGQPQPPVGRANSSQGPPSVADSAAEYFDASDDILCGSSSEVSDESGLSDGSTTNSEPEEGHVSVTRKYRARIPKGSDSAAPKSTGRRTTLPSTCPDNSHVGLMTILYNNIGKDLARVSMPAALNEPVNLLQRLCEELEYSELLDTANNTPDPYQRMVYIAAFAISGYATATFRNRYKPFNPVLGETFECTRDDRGFRFISEQVCHHPPISACHAESDHFAFWQDHIDQRWKNKFWGKSLEILPTGMVNVILKRFGDHYEWNKVVTCIHNVLSQQRYLEHYGEVTIRNLKSDACTCRITFVKSRYWGSDANKNEVQGTVLDQSGNILHSFGGLWHEGIFCDTLPTPKCVWKPNPQPEDYLLYYGFSTFATELNELPPDLKPLLPPSDTRLRPDQRMLEEGKVDEADKKKDEIEEFQRERRKALSKLGEEHVPRFFKKSKDSCGRDIWISNETYWKLRENPGFSHLENPRLW
uniref:Oxysterol-binding protein n=1 Tax=Tetraodon nigroviridis TaxID=99883 RepID=H3CXL4_TETNG